MRKTLLEAGWRFGHRSCGCWFALPSSSIRVEITESALARDQDVAEATLCELQANGISIAMDDFGTGYSSLHALHRLPIDSIKIDRSFVEEMEVSQRIMEVTSKTVDLVKALGFRVVVEGIENAEQMRLAHDLGCDLFQGYLISPPIAPGAVVELLEREEVLYARRLSEEFLVSCDSLSC